MIVSIKQVFLLFTSALYFLSLEIHLYKGYFFISLICFLFLIIFICVNKSLYFIKDNTFYLWLGFSLSSLLFSIIYVDFTSSAKAILIFFSFYVSYSLRKNKVNILEAFLKMGFICAIVSYGITFFKDSFLLWSTVLEGRNPSIFFDPNYAAVIFALVALLSLIVIKSNLLKIILFLFFLGALFFTYSKGGFVAFFLGCLAYIYCKYSYKVIPIVVFFCFIALNIFFMLSIDLSLFRFEQGMNARDMYFNMTMRHVFDEFNLFGGGNDNMMKLIFLEGGTNHSTHNYYLDLLLVNGIVPFFFLIPLLIIVFYRGLVNKHPYFPLFIVLFVSSNAVSISVGGIGILSIIYTFCMIAILYDKKLNA